MSISIKNFTPFAFLTFLFLIFASGVFASEDIDFLSLPEKDFGVQDATKVVRQEGSVTVRGIRVLLAARIPIDALLYRNFSLTLQSSNDTTGFLFWGKDSRVRLHSFVIEKSESPKEYAFDLWTFSDFKGSLGIVGFGFQDSLGKEQIVTVSRMVLEEAGSSPFINGIKQFFAPEYITFSSINVFFGPRLWDKPFNVWILLIFFTAIIVVLCLFLIGKNVSWHKAGIVMFLIAIMGWMGFDARNVLNLFVMAKRDLKDLAVSPRYEKLYDGLQNLYGFLNFVKDAVPQDASLSFVSGFGVAHELRAEYMLRPLDIALGIPENVASRDFLALYMYQALIDEQEKTITIGKTVVRYEEIIPFHENSFIVKIK